MDETGGYYAKCNKPNRETRYHLYVQLKKKKKKKNIAGSEGNRGMLVKRYKLLVAR